MLALGGLLYVHPVAGPGVALAVWTALLTLKPHETAWASHFARMVLLGLVFVVSIAPFAWHYASHWQGARLDDIGALMDIARVRLLPGYLDLAQALQDLFVNQRPNLPVWLVAGIGCAFLATRQDGTARLARAFAAMFAALFVFSFGLTYAEHRIAEALGRFPLQIDLVRTFRYLLLFIPLFGLWPLARMARRKPELRVGAVAAALVLVAVWNAAYRTPWQVAWSGAACLLGPAASCASPELQARRDLLQAVGALTPPGSLIYAASDELGLVD